MGAVEIVTDSANELTEMSRKVAETFYRAVNGLCSHSALNENLHKLRHVTRTYISSDLQLKQVETLTGPFITLHSCVNIQK
jgi:hypothetical protein